MSLYFPFHQMPKYINCPIYRRYFNGLECETPGSYIIKLLLLHLSLSWFTCNFIHKWWIAKIFAFQPYIK